MIRRLPGFSGTCGVLITTLMIASFALAADKDAAPAPTASSTAEEILQLKRLLLEQQRQIDELRRSVQEQKPQSTEATPPSARKPLGEVASTTPMIPAAP